MVGIVRQVVDVVYTYNNVWDGVGYVAITATVFTGGLIVWSFLVWLFEYLALGDERRSRYVLSERNELETVWEQKPARTCRSVLRVVLQTLFFAGVAFIIWIAAASAGFNVWTSALMSVAISAIAAYTFGTPLGLLGNGFVGNITNIVVVGQHLEIHGLGETWTGRVIAIYYLWIELERYDEVTKSAEIIQIPWSDVLSRPRKRNYHRENTAKRVVKSPSECKAEPHTHNNNNSSSVLPIVAPTTANKKVHFRGRRIKGSEHIV